MGKKYYCEYCDKRFKDDPNIRKKHIEGLPHLKARNEHYAQFKTPKEILQEEHKKKPCAKFPNGTCQFGAMCRFSHYTPAQLMDLQQQVNLEHQKALESQKPKIYSMDLIDGFMKRRKLAKEQHERQFLKDFFKYPEELLKREHELPPSLKPYDPELLRQDFKLTLFG